MPTYAYKCNSCNCSFEEFHLMSETVEHCVKCNSSDIERAISSTINIKKSSVAAKNKPGKVVKEYIKNVKEDLKAQKEELKKENLT